MPGLPWVLTVASTTPGAPDRIIFHKITKSLTVRNTSTTAGDLIGVGFTPAGVTGSNYYVIPGDQAHTFDIGVAELYIDAKSGTPGYTRVQHLGRPYVDRCQRGLLPRFVLARR